MIAVASRRKFRSMNASKTNAWFRDWRTSIVMVTKHLQAAKAQLKKLREMLDEINLRDDEDEYVLI